jgi:hypothetical protein
MSMKLVHILWRDAMSMGGDGWVTRESMDGVEKGDTLIEDVGWILTEDDDKICLVGGKSLETDNSLLAAILHRVLFIPKGCIVKMKTLK